MHFIRSAPNLLLFSSFWLALLWFFMPFRVGLAMSPEDYVSVLQTVSSSIPPFLESNGKPFVPPIAWLAAFNVSLVTYQVFGGRGMDLTETQKNRLLLDILCAHGEQHSSLRVDGVHTPLDATPHATLVQVIQHHLEKLAASHATSAPTLHPTGTGKP